MKIALFGDTVFGGDYLDYCKIRNIEPVRQFKYIADKLSAHADAALVNLEGSIADGPENLSGTSTILRNDKQIIDVFGSFKKVIFNIANNHILDYGEQGFRQWRPFLISTIYIRWVPGPILKTPINCYQSI
jgi:hypothetical protein